MPTTKAVVTGFVATIAWGALWAIAAAHGTGDGPAARKVRAEYPGAGCDEFAANTAEGAGTGVVVEDAGAAATVADGRVVSATPAATEFGITGIGTGGRPRPGDVVRAPLFPAATARAVASVARGSMPADAAERGDVDSARNSGVPAARPPEADPRAGWAGLDAAALPAAVSTFDDESRGPGSAAASPQPAESAAPTPTATASPRTRRTEFEAPIVSLGIVR